MINFLGKAFVLVHTCLSIALLAWALAVYTQVADWGYAVPRKTVVDKSIPSEYDKSLAALQEGYRGWAGVEPAIAPAEAALAEAESYFPKNHLYYVEQLKTLQTAADAIEVKAIKAGGVPLDTPKKPLGKPVLDDAPVEGVTKSLQAYQADLKQKEADVKKVEEEIREVTEKAKKVTYQLTGKDDAGKTEQPGLYDLIDLEYRMQVANKAERDYLKPIWSQKVNDAAGLAQRRANLEATLKKYQPARSK